MKIKAMVICVVAAVGTAAYAQEGLPTGKYSGSFQGGRAETRLVIEIKKVEGEKVEGTAERFVSSRRGGVCQGEIAFEGTFKENKLDARAVEKGGRGGDCGATMHLTLVGTKLVGTFGQNQVELTK